MGTNFIYRYGTEDHRRRLFLPAIRGEKVAAFALTEPDAGSDLMAVRTSAERVRDGYVINGMKTWITNAPYADFFTVLCQTDRSKGAKGLNFFLIERDTPGLSVSPKFEKLGTRGTLISELAFDNCYIPSENMLGEEGKGMKNLLGMLAEIRVMTAALSLGLARAAYDASFQYAQERVQFGKPIGNYQAIQMKIATMATEIEASRLMVYNTTKMMDEGKRCLKEASMAKYFVSEVACRAADEATRIYGSYAYSSEYPIERFYRDSRFLLYGAGTSEILQVIIARELGLVR
jgi:alkylation response protein AidB-like acyl-CoA dehydrogenase